MSVIPDYAQRDAWLLRPETPVAAADVFYLIPTEYHQGKEPPVCEIDNPTVRALGMRHLQHKASAFFRRATSTRPCTARPMCRV